MTSLPDARELASYTLELQHPVTRGWSDDDRRIRSLTEIHELDVLLATDLDVAQSRAERFAPDLPPTALLNRWEAVGRGLHAMMSIRFEGQDPEKPFVDATPVSRAITADDLPLLADAAQQLFGALAPGYVRAWSAEPVGAFPGSVHDRRFLAGELAALRLRSTDLPAGLDLRQASSVANYDDARRAYESVRRAHSGHAGQASLQPADDLEESAGEGLLFDVLVDGRWAGYVGATRNSDTLGLPAYVVLELVLAPRHRGQGYGAHLSTLLSRALPAAPETVLIGTIHAENQGAIQAAVAAGRIDVGGWIQVPIAR